MGLATQLQQLGHETIFIGNELVVDVAKERGVEAIRLPISDVKGPVPYNESIPVRWMHYDERMAYSLAKLGVDGVENLFADIKPDLVLVDQEMAHIVIPLVGMGVNTALVSNYLCTVSRPGMPPLSDYCVPGDGFLGTRTGIRWLWWKYRFRRWVANTRNWIASGRVNRISTLMALARKTGFDTRRHLRLYEWLIPFNLVSLPMIYTPPEVFEFPHEIPEDTLYLGCTVDESRRSDTIEATLEAILDRRDTDRRLVYCSFGTFFEGDDTSFMQRVVEALNELEDIDIVIGLGGRGDVDALGMLAPHVVARTWVPQLDVLDAADAALIHAGSGTIAECLFYGVPFVTYPFDVNDQLGSASRAVYHGIGVLGDREGDSVSEIMSKVMIALDDPTIRSNVDEMRDRYFDSVQDGRLKALIDKLLSGKGPDGF
ncbi:MAG: hypothetical protein Rubg2KO_21650 [Rubricoccaceae bacterium]